MAQTLALRPDRSRLIGKLDFTRISAEAGAIAINAAALLLLLAPLNMHVPQAVQPDVFYDVIPVKPKDNPKPPKPEPVPVTKPHVVPTTSPVMPLKIERQPIPPVDAQAGDIATDPVEVAKADPVGDAIAPPLAGAHLEYEVAPPPPYPAMALREGMTGTVMLRVLVDVDGKPIDVQIERSSGYRVLDAAAKRHLQMKWRFKPAMQDGHAVQAIGLIPIDFTLSR